MSGLHKSRLEINRPLCVGKCILDLSKFVKYNFYYNQMKAQYGNPCQLLYTDADSLLLAIQTEDVYKDMAEMCHLYDTSDYPIHSKVNVKILGKDER